VGESLFKKKIILYRFSNYFLILVEIQNQNFLKQNKKMSTDLYILVKLMGEGLSTTDTVLSGVSTGNHVIFLVKILIKCHKLL
jgi:hypothetical protein